MLLVSHICMHWFIVASFCVSHIYNHQEINVLMLEPATLFNVSTGISSFSYSFFLPWAEPESSEFNTKLDRRKQILTFLWIYIIIIPHSERYCLIFNKKLAQFIWTYLNRLRTAEQLRWWTSSGIVYQPVREKVLSSVELLSHPVHGHFKIIKT